MSSKLELLEEAISKIERTSLRNHAKALLDAGQLDVLRNVIIGAILGGNIEDAVIAVHELL